MVCYWNVKKMQSTILEVNDSRLTINSDGDIEWINLRGYWHRNDGPALVCSNGDKHWCRHGKLNRFDGPAIEYSNNRRYWFIDDVEYTEMAFKEHPLVVMHRFVTS